MRELAREAGYDAGYISRLASGKQRPSSRAARRLDEILAAHGDLAAGAVPPRLRGLSGNQALSDADTVSVPCRALDGKIIFVAIPRRTFLQYGAAALTAATGNAREEGSQVRPAGIDGAKAAEHFRQLRSTLIDSDNLLGPRHVIPAVRSHMEGIGQLRERHAGADGRDLLHVQAEYGEFLSWLCHDTGDFPAAQYWLDRSLEWSQAVADREMTAYFLVRKSQLAGDMRNPATAVGAADAAARAAKGSRRLQAAAATFAAHGHAVAGQQAECLRAIATAHTRAAVLDDGPAPQWAPWLDRTYIEAQRARCLSVLGKHREAAHIFAQAIRSLPSSYRRDRGVYLAREAVAHARAREPEEAAAAGLGAMVIAQETGSGRVISELANLSAVLAPWKNIPAAAGFRDALAALIPLTRP